MGDNEPISGDAETPQWRCFHCDEVFTTPGAARDHFGGEGAEAGCLIDRVALEAGGTPERGRGLLIALRKAEAEIESLRRANEQLDHEAGCYHVYGSELERYFGTGATTPHGAWLRFEAKQGEIEALEASLAAARAERDATQRIMRPANDQADRPALLRRRAEWYREGCPDLEDTSGYLLDGLAADAADDLVQALELAAAAEAQLTAARAERDEAKALNVTVESMAHERLLAVAAVEHHYVTQLQAARAEQVFVTHLKDENTNAHLALDRLRAPKTKAVPTRDLSGKQDITLGLAERIELARAEQERLRDQLRTFGQHLDRCKGWRHETISMRREMVFEKCNCGLRVALIPPEAPR